MKDVCNYILNRGIIPDIEGNDTLDSSYSDFQLSIGHTENGLKSKLEYFLLQPGKFKSYIIYIQQHITGSDIFQNDTKLGTDL